LVQFRRFDDHVLAGGNTPTIPATIKAPVKYALLSFSLALKYMLLCFGTDGSQFGLWLALKGLQWHSMSPGFGIRES
jgi:hypothetical protein